MKATLRTQIIDFIRNNKNVRPDDLRKAFEISGVAVHNHLRKLLSENQIVKHGKPPLVFYSLSKTSPLQDEIPPSIPKETENFLRKNYLYISPSGDQLEGFEGFQKWASGLRLEKQIPSLVSEYEKIRKDADAFIVKGKGYINATEKVRNTFKQLALDGLFYKDFYGLPKFGKTRLGAMLLFAKQGQNIKLIHEISKECQSTILALIKEKKVDSVAFVPHSIPRQIQFLKEFEKDLKLSEPKIEIVKAYTGAIQVPQKSLSKLEERILNAENTFFLKKNPIKTKSVLLIDDAVGSGATMNAVAEKIREHYSPKQITGFAAVGSYKGFEVIKEV